MCVFIYFVFGDLEWVFYVEDCFFLEFVVGQVCLWILFFFIYNYDFWIVCGIYGFKFEFLVLFGMEVFGVVDVFGEGVDYLMVGQCVVMGGIFGVWVEYIVVDVVGLVLVLDVVLDEVVVQFVLMFFSMIMLFDFFGVCEGDWIVQNVVNGVVGWMFVQFGVVCGVNVFGFVCCSVGVEELCEQGIDCIVVMDQDDWQVQVEVIMGGVCIVVGVDLVGGVVFGQVFLLFVEGGILVVFGVMDFFMMEIVFLDVIFKQVIVKGFWGSKVIFVFDQVICGLLFGEFFQCFGDGMLILFVVGIFDVVDIVDVVCVSNMFGWVGKVLLCF